MLAEIDDNFYQHSWKIPAQTDGMNVHHLENISYVNSGMSCDTFNIIHVHGNALQKNEIEEAVHHFRSRGLAYCIWINNENLSSDAKAILSNMDVAQQNAEEGMVLNLSNYPAVTSNQHDNIEVVSSKGQLKEYARVIAENWSPPDQHVISYYDTTSDQYLAEKNKIILLIYYHDGKPASTVEMFPSSNEIIGLYGFATLEAFRGLGIGTSLMTFVLNKAKELGYKHAILQASEDGIGIYRKFGFKELTTYFEYA